MCVSKEDRSPLTIYGCNTAPTPSSFTESSAAMDQQSVCGVDPASHQEPAAGKAFFDITDWRESAGSSHALFRFDLVSLQLLHEIPGSSDWHRAQRCGSGHWRPC